MTLHSEETSKQSPSLKSNGYLFCRKCKGYYHLQGDETREDFLSCECGGELVFYETLPGESQNYDSKDKQNYDSTEEIDDFVEMEQLLTLIKSKSEKRKALIQNLSNHIEIQEELLDEIKEERWNLWDVLNERNLQNDIKNQKRLLDEISENEDKLMSVIKEQRTRAKSTDKFTFTEFIRNIGTRGFIILEFMVIVVLLILLLV